MATAKKTSAKKTSATKSATTKTAAKKTPTKKSPAKKSPAKKVSTKRTLVEPHAGDKRYVRRDEDGQFKESDDVSKSLSQDVRKHAKIVTPSGQGDKGDAKPAAKKSARKSAKQSTS